jgi:surface protein
MFFIYWIHRRLLPPLVVQPAFVCVVFISNTAFNSDISKWNTGAVRNMNGSKFLSTDGSFVCGNCVVCCCSCWHHLFYLFNSSYLLLFVQCSDPIQPSIRTFRHGTQGPWPLCLAVSLSSTVASFMAIVLFVVVEVVLTIFLFIHHFHDFWNNPFSQYLTAVPSNERCVVVNGLLHSLRLPDQPDDLVVAQPAVSCQTQC